MLVAALVGLIWGLAEGTFFFFIPDIALSFIALKGWKPALAATLAVVIGSMLGAVFLYAYLGGSDATALLQLKEFWARFPGFYPKMFKVAADHLSQFQAQGLTKGPNSGIPYRFYVAEAFQQKIPLSSILLWTPIARLERIALAPAVVVALRFILARLARKLPALATQRTTFALIAVIAIYWVCIYIWYWGQFLPSQYGS